MNGAGRGTIEDLRPAPVPFGTPGEWMAEIPRLVPDERLPAYAFVPGQFPHPVSDPMGHSHGVVPLRQRAIDPSAWQGCRPYLFGLDLFNHGYYWEAHEQWESLWHGCGRKGTTADFLKGLIQLAAAGVKAREGKEQGLHRHARRAAALFLEVDRALDPGQEHFLGLVPRKLAALATALAGRHLLPQSTPLPAVEVVFSFALVPRRTQGKDGSASVKDGRG
jgi:hypothetical protein